MQSKEQTSVLITGGNKGLGFAAAQRLGAEGWTIFLGSRDESRGRAATDELTASGASAVMVPLDVTSDESVAAAVKLVRGHTDRLDVLVNNAGNPGHLVTPADATVDEVHPVFDTNVYGPLRVTHAFLPLLRAADHPRVVMVSSGIGSMHVATEPARQPVPNPDDPAGSQLHELAYSSSKAALNMMSVQYARAIPEIKFNVASPGEFATGKWAATDMNHHTGQLTASEGADPIVQLATIDSDGPTATFIDRVGPVPW